MFFQYNIQSNESISQVLSFINPVRTGNHSRNLERHRKSFHKEIYVLLVNEKKKNLVEIVQQLKLVIILNLK
jgi:hypothetical protein